jgi:hypothetical protein
MSKTLPSIVLVLMLAAAAALAGPPAAAEEAAAPAAIPAAAPAAECAAPVAPAAADEALLLAGTPCGPVTCSGRKVCCDASCGICGREGGPCPDVPACVSTPLGGPDTPALGDQPEPLLLAGEPCNRRHCGANQFCCNFSCSICAPEGGFCTQQLCE